MNILLFLVILVVLILVHELGHFIVAKWARMRVDEFGVGFPPRLWGKKIGETMYSVNLVPAGGFVKIFGEDAEELHGTAGDVSRSFAGKPRFVQAVTLVAGVGANVILGWLLFSAAFMLGTPAALTPEPEGKLSDIRTLIVAVLPNSPAFSSGLMAGDEILAIAGGGDILKTLNPESISAFIAGQGTEEVVIRYRRAGRDEEVSLVPQAGLISEEATRQAIGVTLGLVGTLKESFSGALIEGATLTAAILPAIAVALFSFIVGALTLSADFSQIAGPVGIVGLVGNAASLGFVSLITFTAFISLNLAIINLIPFPALDGGRLLFVGIEALKGSPIKPAIAHTLNSIGFALLILLMLVVTYNDLARLF